MKNSLSAKNKEQRNAILSIVKNPITIITGRPGTGKSILAVGIAVEHLLANKCDKVIFSRPLVCTGKALPALPGTLEEKLHPYWMQIQDYVQFFAGDVQAKRLLDEERIKFVPLELMRGFNLNRTYLVLTEAQNATYEQLKMLFTRIGDDTSRLIIDGDLEQTDLKTCELARVIEKIQHLDEIGMVELIECLRHPLVEKIARLL